MLARNNLCEKSFITKHSDEKIPGFAGNLFSVTAN